jgi:hypothetical protein
MSQPIQNSNLSGFRTFDLTMASSRFAAFTKRSVDDFPAAFSRKHPSEFPVAFPTAFTKRSVDEFPAAFSKRSSIIITGSTFVSPELNDSEHTFIKDKMSRENDRRIFAYKGNKSCEITATGIIYYKKIDDKIQLLIVHNFRDDCLEDLGGKTDICDISPLASASREAEEETNNVISRSVSKGLLSTVEPIYIKSGKYLLFLVEAPKIIQNLKKENFGNSEKCHNKIKSWTLDRIIDWISLEDFMKSSKIHIRLRDALDKISKII